MYKRFFAFGCSYTRFEWPTWADILAYDLDIEYHNYGIAGLGNVGIMHEVVKADIIHQFDENDLIIIIWSHWNREDRWINGRWAGFGCIFDNPAYDRKFIKKYWSFSNDIIKNSTAIISTNKMLGDKLAFQGHIMEPAEREQSYHTEMSSTDNELLKFYLPYIPKTGIFKNNLVYEFDGHPTVEAYIEYVNNVIIPSLNMHNLKGSTVRNFSRIDEKIHKISQLPVSTEEKFRRVNSLEL